MNVNINQSLHDKSNVANGRERRHRKLIDMWVLMKNLDNMDKGYGMRCERSRACIP